MFKEKFENIVQKDEEIKLIGNINVKAYVVSTTLSMFLFGLFPPIALVMLGTPYSLIVLVLALFNIIPLWIGITHFLFTILVVIIFMLILKKNANNTYFCITNKRIIKRHGTFNNKFINYSLKNIGTIEVKGSIFDTKESATLVVTIKDFHNNTAGGNLTIKSLNKAYEAYNVLNELTEGNNEVLRIKTEK